MQKYNRNDKTHQRQRMQDCGEAEHALLGLHGLLKSPGRSGITVGEMVGVAISMGLLDGTRGKGTNTSSKKVS